jgi:hypothetical protein
MAPSSLTLQYESVLSTTLFNWAKTLQDTISKSNYFIYALMKSNGWETLDDIGDRAAYPLMYELGAADAYSGYDVLDTTPIDGLTSAFFDWRQGSVPISISGLEERKNNGEARIVSLLEAKTKQAELGLIDFVNKSMFQGAGGSSITTAYTSSVNGAQFVDPLPLLINYDPTDSLVVGNINQATYSWWQNQFHNSTSSSYAAFQKELRNLKNDCGKGPGGYPDMYISDQNVAELYEASLAHQHRNTSYQKADLPFENILLFGKPLTWDEYVPDVQGGSVTQSTTSGTLWMINSQFFKFRVDSTRNFSQTPFVKPENQDARVSHNLFLGALCVGNRRKQGVMGGIDTTIAS